MPLPEIEFELPASQHELLGFPALRQGQSLALILDAGVLLPDPAALAWFTVQPQLLPAQLVHVAPGQYAFSGQITDAEIVTEEGQQSATVAVECGFASVRATCAPRDDGRLPYGTWETRYLAGYAPLTGMIEDEYTTGIGEMVGVTIWYFRRLVLTPGDPLFGQWHETDELPPNPYQHDRILVTARVHRRGI